MIPIFSGIPSDSLCSCCYGMFEWLISEQEVRVNDTVTRYVKRKTFGWGSDFCVGKCTLHFMTDWMRKRMIKLMRLIFFKVKSHALFASPTDCYVHIRDTQETIRDTQEIEVAWKKEWKNSSPPFLEKDLSFFPSVREKKSRDMLLVLCLSLDCPLIFFFSIRRRLFITVWSASFL